MNLTGDVPVCLHCGEVAPDGTLFCTKCGYTLPQTPGAATAPPAGAAPVTAPPPTSVTPPTIGPAWGPVVPPGSYAAPVNAMPGAVGALLPPPGAKLCARCATPISIAAVYCPVCQQPQP